MRFYLIFIFVWISYNGFCQDNVFPQFGKTGIGTIEPKEALHVNGNLIVDSIISSRGFIGIGDVKFPELEFGNPDSLEFILGLKDGLVKQFPLQSLIGSKAPFGGGAGCFESKIGVDGVGIQARIPPVWESSTSGNVGLLFTGSECPTNVGIGLGNPRVELEVLGDQLVSGSLTLGGEELIEDNSTLLKVKSDEVNRSVFSGWQDHFNGVNVFGNGRVNLVFKDYTNTVDRIFSIVEENNSPIFVVADDGITYVRELFVLQPNEFPDYVFSDNYELESIKKLKKYISENKKLPGMPSANEVSENGQNISEIQRVLVEKVEELYLHIIELTERIEKCENSN